MSSSKRPIAFSLSKDNQLKFAAHSETRLVIAPGPLISGCQFPFQFALPHVQHAVDAPACSSRPQDSGLLMRIKWLFMSTELEDDVMVKEATCQAAILIFFQQQLTIHRTICLLCFRLDLPTLPTRIPAPQRSGSFTEKAIIKLNQITCNILK